MTRRSIFWRVVAVLDALFILVNLYGGGIAAGRREALHTAIHVVLLLVGVLGAYLVWRLAPERGERASRFAADQRANFLR